MCILPTVSWCPTNLGYTLRNLEERRRCPAISLHGGAHIWRSDRSQRSRTRAHRRAFAFQRARADPPPSPHPTAGDAEDPPRLRHWRGRPQRRRRSPCIPCDRYSARRCNNVLSVRLFVADPLRRGRFDGGLQGKARAHLQRGVSMRHDDKGLHCGALAHALTFFTNWLDCIKPSGVMRPQMLVPARCVLRSPTFPIPSCSPSYLR